MGRVFGTLIILGIGVALMLVLSASQEGTLRVMLPSEVIDAGQSRPRVRVPGRVSTQQIDYAVEPRIELKFSVQDPEGDGSKMLPVVYAGTKPDMFAPGRDVIIEGEYRDGVLYASQLMTQCPSKYEPPKPTE